MGRRRGRGGRRRGRCCGTGRPRFRSRGRRRRSAASGSGRLRDFVVVVVGVALLAGRGVCEIPALTLRVLHITRIPRISIIE